MTNGTMDWTALPVPGLCVLAMTLVYALLIRWLFRRRLDVRLAWISFLATGIFVGLVIGSFFISSLGQSLAPAALAELQGATTLGAIFKLALLYAALPEEATKIGIVVILLLSLSPSRWLRSRSDPAEMLIYAALGFATCESLFYVVAMGELPQFREHLLRFAVLRGIFGGLLHGLLAMVAGFFLAWRWQSAQRWFWLFCAYAIAVLLHAAFDGSLLHLVFESIRGANRDLAQAVGVLLIPFLASSALLLVLGLVALFASRRLGSKSTTPVAAF